MIVVVIADLVAESIMVVADSRTGIEVGYAEVLAVSGEDSLSVAVTGQIVV